jgi:hypothetical protein
LQRVALAVAERLERLLGEQAAEQSDEVGVLEPAPVEAMLAAGAVAGGRGSSRWLRWAWGGDSAP